MFVIYVQLSFPKASAPTFVTTDLNSHKRWRWLAVIVALFICYWVLESYLSTT